MIFRLSQVLNTKVKAGALVALPLHENPLLDWSAHSFLLNRRQFILVSNTKSMLSVVLPGQGITGQALLTERALGGIQECLESYGHESVFRRVIAPGSESVRFAKALNRSVSGSMTEQVKYAEFCMADGDLTLLEVGHRLNGNLLSALAGVGGSHGYGKPKEAFQVLVNEAESKASGT